MTEPGRKDKGVFGPVNPARNRDHSGLAETNALHGLGLAACRSKLGKGKIDLCDRSLSTVSHVWRWGDRLGRLADGGLGGRWLAVGGRRVSGGRFATGRAGLSPGSMSGLSSCPSFREAGSKGL